MIFFCVGIQGYRIHLDDNGDVEFNLTLLDIRPNEFKKEKYGRSRRLHLLNPGVDIHLVLLTVLRVFLMALVGKIWRST